MDSERRDDARPPERARPRRAGFTSGALFGVDVSLDFTRMLVFLLVATNVDEGTLPRRHPDWSPGLVWAVGLAFAGAIVRALTKDADRGSRCAAFAGQVFGWCVTALGISTAYSMSSPMVTSRVWFRRPTSAWRAETGTRTTWPAS